MINIALLGAGYISGIYCKNLTSIFSSAKIIGVYDLFPERAVARAAEFGIPKIYASSDELLADPDVQLVLNLTQPLEHYPISKAALLAGKSVFTEKPVAAEVWQARELQAIAAEKGVLLGGAPDTFLGSGIQTCRRLIDSGAIGRPVAAFARMYSHGPEHKRPDPDFMYKYGGGPMLDMGPYYVTSLIYLLGAVESVSAVAVRSFDERPVIHPDAHGRMIKVEVPTHVSGQLCFASGAVGTLITTFDVFHQEQNLFEVYGSEGTLVVPDPNKFGGLVKLLKRGEKEFSEVPLFRPEYSENSRGIGLTDMAIALSEGRRPAAGADQLIHALEVMKAFEASSDARRPVRICSYYDNDRPSFLDRV